MGGCLDRTWLAQKTMGCGRDGLAWIGRELSFFILLKISMKKKYMRTWLETPFSKPWLVSKNPSLFHYDLEYLQLKQKQTYKGLTWVGRGLPSFRILKIPMNKKCMRTWLETPFSKPWLVNKNPLFSHYDLEYQSKHKHVRAWLGWGEDSLLL